MVLGLGDGAGGGEGGGVGGEGGVLTSCTVAGVRLKTLASLTCRDGSRRVFTEARQTLLAQSTERRVCRGLGQRAEGWERGRGGVLILCIAVVVWP